MDTLDHISKPYFLIYLQVVKNLCRIRKGMVRDLWKKKHEEAKTAIAKTAVSQEVVGAGKKDHQKE